LVLGQMARLEGVLQGSGQAVTRNWGAGGDFCFTGPAFRAFSAVWLDRQRH
jgi:hypothetical protein